jgi:hypothetical protein
MTGSHVPHGYRLRVEGHLDDHWSASFDCLALARENDGTTSLTGAVADQAALHGLLAKIRDLGILVISVDSIGVTEHIRSDPAEGIGRSGETTKQD